MTQQEAAKLVTFTLANFPNMQDKDLTMTAKLWATMLSDIPYEVAKNALVKVLATAKFFPTVAEIREAAAQLTQPNIPTALEAWGEVTRAMRLYGYYRPEEALASMSPITAEVVRRFGWREMCACEEPDVLRGQFRMAYEQYAGRQKEMAVLPENVRSLIGGLANQLAMGDSDAPAQRKRICAGD